jgi:hypothetical protein
MLNINKLIVTVFIFCVAESTTLSAQKVAIQYDTNNIQAAYAARNLVKTLANKGYELSLDRTDFDYNIQLVLNTNKLSAEAFAIVPKGKIITIQGGDNRGLIYGALALAETLENGTALDKIKEVTEAPNLEFRGIKYNLPWETYRPSSALDQHLETAKDLKYWEAFLDMMVRNRFNVVSLWNMHPYTFMVRWHWQKL